MIQVEMFDKEPHRSRAADPTTSKEAEKRVPEFSAKMYKRIYEELCKGEGTYEDLSVRMGLRHDQLSKRLPEMQRLGIIDVTGEVKEGSSGRLQRIWKIIEENK